MPISTAAEIIAVRAPQWASNPHLTDMIALAALITAEATFLEKYQLALALRVLHAFAKDAQTGGDPAGGTSGGEGQAGAIATEKEGDLMKSYRPVSFIVKGKANLSSTAYGTELLELMDICIMKVRNRFV